jgi:homoserine dehydrogenase
LNHVTVSGSSEIGDRLKRRTLHYPILAPVEHKVSFLPMDQPSSIQVIKCGGSVLGSDDAIAATCTHLAEIAAEGTPLIVVVSAPAGVTDALYQSVSLEASTSGDEIAEHVSSGERMMAARLKDQLQAMGVHAAALTVHDIGLRASGPSLDADPISLDVPAILHAMESTPVLLVPGFAGVCSSGARRLLGRGGSDISAIFIAAELGASCRLLQKVAGVYEKDPALHHLTPTRFSQMHWDDLMELDDEVVQSKAVLLAKQRQLAFSVTSLDPAQGTLVGNVQPVLASGQSRHASS